MRRSTLNKNLLQSLSQGVLTASLALAAGMSQADGDALGIIAGKCGACHTQESAEPGAQSWSRISHQRKTPEGWLMTIARMQVMHGLEITDAQRREVVKYLADQQGLAPSEAEDYRYVLERRMNAQESITPQPLAEGCARCHSGARFKLQRRNESEWEHLAHFHLGQWPSTEYQMLARDRDWFPMILNDIVPLLGEQQPLLTDAWSQWQQAPEAQVTGHWVVAGHMPGKGDMNAVMIVTAAAGDDQYKVMLEGQYADGSAIRGEGSATLYTGYEWRANLMVDGVKMRQVFAIQNGQLAGRMFSRQDDSVGVDIRAISEQHANAGLIAIQPAYLKAGSETELTLVGTGLDADVSLGDGVRVLKVLERSDTGIKVLARADANHQGINQLSSQVTLATYQTLDQIQVTPAYAVARVGANGGATNKLSAHFEAEAWSAGNDGELNTADDFRIGVVPAEWQAKPFDAVAEADEDLKFAGQLNPSTGVFSTAGAGPNAARKMSTNNAGHLTVTAQVQEGEQTLSADAELIVTVQRWNNPPIP